MGKSKDAFRTISEVAEWLDTQAHVLRFWESKFSQVKPVKRAGGRRYYRPADMLLLGGIKKLLHDDGMTIKGAQKLLREKGVKHVSGLSQSLDDDLNDDLQTTPVQADDLEKEVETAAVLEFASTTPPAPALSIDDDLLDEDLSDMVGDLVLAGQSDTQDIADEPDESDAPFGDAEDDDVIPSQDEMPAFVQRATTEDAPTETSVDSASSDPATDMDAAPVPEVAQTQETQEEPGDETSQKETAAASEAADSETVETAASDVDNDTPKEPAATVMESKTPILYDLSRTSGIARENRPATRELLQKLQALRDRIAQTENA
ncbi:MerR HTH family regulatory protein [Shimia gijangensis]|uniref:MerR HTH family regulatory protein n=1 Tax=Shimia gijangensis TaxID=1470563 RepID=A0A1M6E494_9RHOB|nr:MerR family transcriptional regulator [Shimia gijangensis]SHI80213.1 MerR HTH family regulatory protein [Shimia gijangensis]